VLFTMSTMYALKPVFDLDAQVEVPTCMYSLPVVQVSQPIPGVGICSEKAAAPGTEGALQAIAARQEAILARLGQLKDQVSAYKQSLGLPPVNDIPPQVSVSRTADLVIRASPSHPPLSLPAVYSLLTQSGLTVHTSSHTHSSVTTPLDIKLTNLLPVTQVARATAQVRLTLIWTEVGPECELMVSPLTQSVIKGEVNLLRYLARLFPSILPYESTGPSVEVVDSLLDSVTSLCWVVPKSRQPLLRTMSANLSKGGYLGGSSLTIADLALFSIIQNLKLVKELQPELATWFKTIGSKFGTAQDEKQSLMKSSKNSKESSAKKEVKTEKSPSKKDLKKKSPEKEVKKERSPLKKVGKENVAPKETINKQSCEGGQHLGKDGLFDFFTKNGIKFTNVEHPEVFTVEAMMPHLKNVDGVVCKNLFLKDKKKNLYLLSAAHDKEVKLNDVAKAVGAKELRFGDEKVMFDILGVSQGAVTAYALVNDKKKAVKFIVDSALLDGSFNSVNFHPMVNTATTNISTQDFAKMLSLTGHTVLKF